MANHKDNLSNLPSNFGLESADMQPNLKINEELLGVPFYHIRCLSSVPVDLESLLLQIEQEEEVLTSEEAQ
ncbi:hypothetical protein LC608_31375 [Nostoc sp. XA010]|uniref:hypothetical protein n=1 Tax=Nostoc sp. XA010 TaxID=2780407 RepID=UPI001E3F68C5|nr:hypothetical protein [Nostoc sp. XA010]MCC5661377.1 hypothetical protein [Nostoc sp. XA010]